MRGAGRPISEECGSGLTHRNPRYLSVFHPKWFLRGLPAAGQTPISTTGCRPPEVWAGCWQDGVDPRACVLLAPSFGDLPRQDARAAHVMSGLNPGQLRWRSPSAPAARPSAKGWAYVGSRVDSYDADINAVRGNTHGRTKILRCFASRTLSTTEHTRIGEFTSMLRKGSTVM